MSSATLPKITHTLLGQVPFRFELFRSIFQLPFAKLAHFIQIFGSPRWWKDR